MSPPVALRGEVWDADLPDVGEHPVVVMSLNALNSVLGNVVGLLVTGTPGPALTHVPIGAEAGLTRYDESFINVTDVVNVDRYDLLARRGRLHPAELATVEARLRTYLVLP